MTDTAHTIDAVDVPPAEHPYRWEFTVGFNRPLDHRKDDPEALEKMLSDRSNYTGGLQGSRRSKPDVTVGVVAFDPEQGAVILVEADRVSDRTSLPTHFRSRIQAIANRAYRERIKGDDLPRHNRVYIEKVLAGEEPPAEARTPSTPAASRWSRAKDTAERLDLEDGPPLGVDVSVRTLEGAPLREDW